MEHRFQVNLRGIIGLLANNLYSGPSVFVRELLQNCIDALHARRLLDGFDQGSIEFELIEDRGASPTLVVVDNGIGLSEAEVHRFLATIGESSKRDELGAARNDFIGQFGIGLLSCFMVADEIVMLTRSARDDGPAVEWRGRPDGTYSVRPLEQSGTVGTRVFLRCKEGSEAFFKPTRVRELIDHYGSLLTEPIWLTTGGARRRINNSPPPWRDGPMAGRVELLDFGRRILDADFFDAIPLRSQAGGVEGAAYVLTHSPSPSARQRHRVYLKNMLLTEQAQGLLPDWAFFVRCIVNSDRLRPTASREGFYEDESLERTREELGGCLRTWLLKLARNDPGRLERFIAIHYLAIKSMAVHDDEFYRIFIDMLPFETSRGQTTMGEYRRAYPQVLYAQTVDQFRQIAAVAGAQNLCVINAGYTYDQDLLLRLPEVFPDVTVERIDAESLTQSFADVSLEEREQCFDLMRLADLVLHPFRCAADLRRFRPAELVALYNISDDGLLMRSARGAADQSNEHWAGMLANAIGDTGQIYARLVFNFDNPLVRRLAGLTDRKLLRRLIELLYAQALLAGHHPMSMAEMKLLNQGLIDLIALAAGKEPHG